MTDMTVALIDHMGTDLSVVNAARVSFAKESDWESDGFLYQKPILSDKDIKLLNYLATHGHWSPFAHTQLQLRVKTPIFVTRQLAKHQIGAAWNEVSRRYVDAEPEFWEPAAWRKRAENAKQGSSDEVYEYSELANTVVNQASKSALETYEWLLKEGVAPEQARMVLPLSMMTEWIWSGSLLFFRRVVSLRVHPGAQQETSFVAAMIEQICKEMFPHSWEALSNANKT